MYGRRYTINVYLDEAGLEAFQKSGSKKELKRDDEGIFVQLTRNETSERKDNKTGETSSVFWGPPKVVVIDPIEGEKLFKGQVGNGSKVTCKVEVYDTKRYGKGTRLVAVRVDELVEFTPSGPVSEDVPF